MINFRAFCEEHYVGEFKDMKMLEGSKYVLYPDESGLKNIISGGLIALAGLILSITQWKKIKNKIILIVAFFVNSIFSYGQYFEGQVVYNNQFTSKIKNFTDEQLGTMIGTKQEYFIREGNYKSFLNGQSITMQLYDSKTNRIYNRKPNSDTLYWFDASINTDEVISYEIKKNIEEILGEKCDAIIMKIKTGTTTVYYSSQYKVNAQLCINHNYSNWAFYVSKVGALPLKTIMETNQFKMVSTASEIKAIKLGQEYFNIDNKTPIKKSS